MISFMVWLLITIGALSISLLIIIKVITSLFEKEEIKKTEKKASGHPTPAPKKGNLLGIIGGIIAVLVIIYLGGSVYDLFWGEKQVSLSPPVTKRETIGKTKTLYCFSDYSDKIIRVNIKGDAEFYPKGGRIKVIPPSGNSFIDKPGISILRPPENTGICIFVQVDQTAWGVEIWQ